MQAIGQGRAFGSAAAPPHGLHQSMAIQHGVNSGGGGSLDGMWQAPQQTFPDFACAPMRFLPLGAYDRRFHLLG